jgi:hypothetical protein
MVTEQPLMYACNMTNRFVLSLSGCLLVALSSGALRRSKWSGIETAADDLPTSSLPLTQSGSLSRLRLTMLRALRCA